MERKEKTQVEFTNTFNDLYYNEKQIIIASDKSIEDYKYLEDRLKNHWSYDRKNDKAQLSSAKLKLIKFRLQLDEA